MNMVPFPFAAPLTLLLSILALYLGARLITDGAVRLANRLGLSQFFIGATVVALGTTLPEFTASVAAMLINGGHPGIVVGNVLGSNLANVGMGLGLSGILFTIYLERKVVDVDVPLLLASAVALFVVFTDLWVTPLEGGLLILTYLGFVYQEIRQPRDKARAYQGELAWTQIPLFLAGMILIYLGAENLISSVLQISISYQIPEATMAFFVVALGTSVPEIATAIVSAREGRGDVAMGNIVGANAMNSLVIVGVSSFLGDLWVDQSLITAALYPIVLLSLVLGFMALNGRISRFEGMLLLALYLLVLINVLAIGTFS